MYCYRYYIRTDNQDRKIVSVGYDTRKQAMQWLDHYESKYGPCDIIRYIFATGV